MKRFKIILAVISLFLVSATLISCGNEKVVFIGQNTVNTKPEKVKEKMTKKGYEVVNLTKGDTYKLFNEQLLEIEAVSCEAKGEAIFILWFESEEIATEKEYILKSAIRNCFKDNYFGYIFEVKSYKEMVVVGTDFAIEDLES